MLEGRITRLTDKGIGFVACDGKKDRYVFHSNGLCGITYEELREGDGIHFEVENVFNPGLQRELEWAVGVRRYDRLQVERDRFVTLLRSLFGDGISQELVSELIERTQGNPFFARALHAEWSQKRAKLHELAGLLTPFSRSMLVDRDGRELDSEAQRQRLVLVRDINAELIQKISSRPALIYEITPTNFEEIVADLFARRGYDVRLTSRGSDGGKDFYAARNDGIGTMLYAVECKRFAPDNKVGVGIVRNLSGVVSHERLNGGFIATTSFFTKDAVEFTKELRWQMQLKDYFDVLHWIGTASKNDK